MPAQPLALEQEGILPTLFGQGYGTYKSKPGAFIASYACNLLVTILLVWSGHWFVQHHKELSRDLRGLIDQATYLLPSSTQAGGGGGGGDQDKLAASNGSPPKFGHQQITPPTAVLRNEAPILPVDPTVVGNPQIQLTQLIVTGPALPYFRAALKWPWVRKRNRQRLLRRGGTRQRSRRWPRFGRKHGRRRL